MHWDNEQQTAIRMTLEGAWQTNEFPTAEQEVQSMLNEVGHEVTVLIHILNPRPIPMSVVPELQHFLSTEHPNRGHMVLVSMSDFLHGLQEIVRRVCGGKVPAHVAFAHSLEEANALLDA